MKKLIIALAGNANVGKSVIFNYFTGLSQHIGNWPGKTVEKAEGSLVYQNYKIEIVDLPGVYSISPTSPEERVAKEYIKTEQPDVVVNIVDASVLERNLYLTFQLLELGVPLILVLNMVDVAQRNGIKINCRRLEQQLSVPVVETVAVHGRGLEKIIEKAIAIKEGRIKTRKIGRSKNATERYGRIGRILSGVEKISKEKEISLDEKIDSIALHRFFGYVILAVVLLAVFFSVFTFGEWLSQLLYGFFDMMKSFVEGHFGSDLTQSILWKGVVSGIFAGLAVAIPFILPFYIVFAILEDSGYIARMAFLMDGFMHAIGLHGKAFIPLFIGYGCNVPACISCRIIETEKERLQTAFLATMIPCGARSVIILGLVGAYLGWQWALAVYLFNILVIVAIGRMASKVFLREPVSLIMEMPSYKMPQLTAIVKRAIERVKHYAVIALPIIVAMSFLISLMEITGLMGPIVILLSPITVGWLGLPAIVGITLIFGVLRKELALITLASIFGTANFGVILSPIQMIIFTLVMIFYIPCSATIATLAKEFGWKNAAAITAFEITFAILLGGIVLRLISF